MNEHGPDQLLSRIAEIDQAAESIRLLGRPVATFYKALVAEGVPREDAVEIIKGWLSTTMILGRESQEDKP